jgi:hypothetical protein
MSELTRSDVCRALRVSRWTLARIVAAGDLTVVHHAELRCRKDSGDRIPRASIEALITRAVVPHDPDRERLVLPDTMYDLHEVSKNWRLPKQPLVEAARAGAFEHIRFGRTRLMTPDQVEALLDMLRFGAPDPAINKTDDPVEAAKERARARLRRAVA